jgi:hypothetical protein
MNADHEPPAGAPTRGDPRVARRIALAAQPASRPPGRPDCCSPGALFGWSPSALPADTTLKRRVDRILPQSGLPLITFFVVVAGLLNIGLVLPTRLDLASIGIASLLAGSWCSLNFWRCRHAHCVITGTGWLALAAFSFIEAGLGRTLIHGDEGLVFLAVLAAGLLFEGAWYVVRGTNAVTSRPS